MRTFNIRVYGLLLNENKILALYEYYAGEKITKLPGGGLEYGEGTIDCLRRELMEELNLQLKSATHFYTQEDFVESRFRQNEQLLTVYYIIEAADLAALKIIDPSIERAEWLPLDSTENPFNLPVDRFVFEKLRSRH